MLSERSRRAQEGFSLIELMVVLMILGVVGSIIAGGLVQAFRANDQAQDRIEAYEDMQIALERVSRDVRAASTPLESVGANGAGIEFERLRDGDGECSRFEYWVDADDALRVSEQRSTDGCTTFGPASDRILVAGLADRTVFTFAGYDEDGDSFPIEDPIAVSDIRGISVVTITLTRELVGGQTGTVQTVVGLRNAS